MFLCGSSYFEVVFSDVAEIYDLQAQYIIMSLCASEKLGLFVISQNSDTPLLNNGNPKLSDTFAYSFFKLKA